MDERTTSRPGARSTLAFGVASAAANVLAYVFTIAISRLFGVRDFGEFGTQLAVWLIALIPAMACQLTAAKAVAASGLAPRAVAAGGPARPDGAVGESGAAGVGGAVNGGSAAGGVAGESAAAVAMVRLGFQLGAAEAGALALAAVPLAAALHVGVPAMLWLAAGQLPLTVLFAVLGIFQGRSAFGRFGLVMAGFQAVRLVAGVAVAAAGLGPAAVWASTGVAALVAGAAGWRLAGIPTRQRAVRLDGIQAGLDGVPVSLDGVPVSLDGVPAGLDGVPRGSDRIPAGGAGAPLAGSPADGAEALARSWAVLARGTASMGGLLLLTTADLLLAGHFLTGDARGIYASGNVLTRIAFWGPQFIGTVAYPWLVRPDHRERARRLALLAVGGLALAGLLLAVLAGRQLAVLLFGPEYRSLGPLVPLFVLLGAAAAVLNVVLLDDVATGRSVGTRLAFTAVAFEAVAVTAWWHSSPGQVVATAATASSAAALLAVARTAGRVPGRRSAGPVGIRLLRQRPAGRHRAAAAAQPSTGEPAP